MESKHDIGELKQKQCLPLKAKVTLTKQRIREWYVHWDGNVYISFSGGKDSTVLLDIARQLYPNIKAVYCDTGLEFPEVKSNVKTFDNIDIIRPQKSFKEVIDEYGWVFPSKEVAHLIRYANKKSNWALNKINGKNNDGSDSTYKVRYKKWKMLLDNPPPFKISEQCCDIMKKKPFKKYEKETGLKPIVGITADESAIRTTSWIRYGCNIYESSREISRPLSVWTEQDILMYIKENSVTIPSIYGDIIEENNKLKTTGEDRTGCMFCLIGCHLDRGDKRKFVRMKKTHPKIYKYCMEQLGMKDILDYIYDFCGCDESLY